LFKLIDWRFSLSTPPLNPSSRSAGVQTRKIVCLKINYLQYYGSGNRQIILDQGKALVDFRRNDEVRKQLESIENPREVRDVGAEEMVVYADEVSHRNSLHSLDASSSINLVSLHSSLPPLQNNQNPHLAPYLQKNTSLSKSLPLESPPPPLSPPLSHPTTGP